MMDHPYCIGLLHRTAAMATRLCLQLRADTCRSSTKCGPSCRLYHCVSRCVIAKAAIRSPCTDSMLTYRQTVRSNEQMMQSMRGATTLLGSMNRQMNLPALQRIAMEFEKENDIMDQRQEMMDDAIDDVTGLEDEEEGEEVVNQVLDEIGIDLGQAVGARHSIPPSLSPLSLCALSLRPPFCAARGDAYWGEESACSREQSCPGHRRR